MSQTLAARGIFDTPEAALEYYISAAAARTEPVPIDSEEGKRVYRSLAQLIWLRDQRPVSPADIRDLWERIDSIKRGAPVNYGIVGVHFWAADFANAIHTETVELGAETNQRLSSWLDDWPNICVLGQTGRGKSTTINRLFGAKMAEINHYRSCTTTVTDYRLVTGQYMGRPTGVVLWDVPGYGDERMPWERYVKLYRRMAKKCDVVLFMLDHERTLPADLKMFKKLRKRVSSARKFVVCINKADLFFPGDWDAQYHVPSLQMAASIAERIALVAKTLGLPKQEQIVPISALHGWNLFALVNALVVAAGDKRAPQLLRAFAKMKGVKSDAEKDLGERFGVPPVLRSKFRKVLEKGQRRTK